MFTKELLAKGKYELINPEFLIEGHTVLENMSLVQEKYHKNDTDTFINELRDSTVGYYLGYNLINTDKHGFDCKIDFDKDIFLEVKSASYSASSWRATFNDTTIEKDKCFQTDKVFLCLAVWKNANDLLFIVYGHNPKIGTFLEEKVKDFLLKSKGVRSTQTTGIKKLIFDYKFDIVCVKSKDSVRRILQLKSKIFFNLPEEQLLSLSEYCKKNNTKPRGQMDEDI